MEDLGRLGRYVMAKRKTMGYRERVDWAPAIKISSKTLGKVERGERVGAGTLADIEVFFGWAPGSCDAIMRGGEPTPAAPEVAIEPAIARQAILGMTWTEIAVVIADVVHGDGPGTGPEAAGRRLEDIVAVKAEARQRT